MCQMAHTDKSDFTLSALLAHLKGTVYFLTSQQHENAAFVYTHIPGILINAALYFLNMSCKIVKIIMQ